MSVSLDYILPGTTSLGKGLIVVAIDVIFGIILGNIIEVATTYAGTMFGISILLLSIIGASTGLTSALLMFLSQT